MEALAPSTPWIPDDDLMLKSAIEAGASLEALAKGAVQFSRRFTIKEIQDRWRSLLYDPVIAAEASAQMIECDRSASKSGRTDNLKENKSVQAKRKGESIRRSFYVLRKRICSRPLLGDLGFLVRSGDFISNGEDPGSKNMLGHLMGKHLALGDSNFGDMHHVFPQGMRDNAPTYDPSEFQIEQNNMAMAGGCTGTKQINSSKELASHSIFEENGIEPNPVCNTKNFICSDFGGNTLFNSPIADCGTSFPHLQYTSQPPVMSHWKAIESIPVQNGDPFGLHCAGCSGKGPSEYGSCMSCDDLKNSTGCTEGFLDEISDSLFNFTSDEEFLGSHEEKNVCDGLSLLLNSSCDGNADNMPSFPERQVIVATNSYFDIASTSGPKETESFDTPLCDIDRLPEAQAQSPVLILDPCPEIRDVLISCTLNTEAPYIPCNFNLVLPSEANSLALPGKVDTGNRTSQKGSGSKQKKSESLRESHLDSQTQSRDISLNHSVDEFGAKFETSRGGACQSDLGVKKEPSSPLVNRPQGCVADKSGHVSNLGRLQDGVGGTSQQGQAPSTIRNQEIYAQGSFVPGGEPLLSDPEEQYSDSDSEIPSFADIESMILNMELEPDDHDTLSSKKVAKYEHEDHRRAIIRLEQNARSCMQRAIASRKAFAVLYNHRSRHFIKKDVVMLGRASDKGKVDIDLGKEGHANKISRRQAKIELKNGMFKLHNLSRYPIYVNDKKVEKEISVDLHSDCLIEVRGRVFIFETNEACVKRHLDRKCNATSTQLGKL